MTPDWRSYQFMAYLDCMKAPYISVLVPFLTTISIIGERLLKMEKKKNKKMKKKKKEKKKKKN